MPEARQPGDARPVVSHTWPSGGRHLWSSGAVSQPQSHSRGHLVYAASGVLAVQVDGGTSIVPADRIAWTPAGWTHRHRAHGRADMRIVFVAPALARLIPDRPAVFVVSGLAREVVLALTGPDNYDDDGPRRDSAARTRLHRILVDELTEARERPLHLPEPRDDRLLAVARRLSERPEDRASLAEHGQAVGASARTLSRLLHNEVGMTFHEWRTQIRVCRAVVFLAEGQDVTRTAHACGWSNVSGFIAAFSDVVGTTPGRFCVGRRFTPSCR